VLTAALAVAVPLHAAAQTADPGSGTDQAVAAAQARADTAANAYFAALNKSQELDGQVANLQQNIAQLEQRVAELRGTARARAVEAYKRSGTPVAAQFGNDASAMDSARRTVLLDLLNARDDDAANQLRHARDDLGTQKDDLDAARQQQADVVNQLKGEEDKLNADLVSAQSERRRVADQQAAAAAAAPAPPASAPAPTGDGAAPAPSSNYTPTAGESPHHNDPFLVCTRARESGGNYQAYNPAGYYGAYQFSQSTWNAAANHAGRGDLVGIDPRNASEYDQDEMAWTLYQWQGKAPWGSDNC
jgi:Transglycosylase-like domain